MSTIDLVKRPGGFTVTLDGVAVGHVGATKHFFVNLAHRFGPKAAFWAQASNLDELRERLVLLFATHGEEVTFAR